MAKNNRKLKVINYPDEREGRIKDANRKLRSDLKKDDILFSGIGILRTCSMVKFSFDNILQYMSFF